MHDNESYVAARKTVQGESARTKLRSVSKVYNLPPVTDGKPQHVAGVQAAVHEPCLMHGDQLRRKRTERL